MRSRTRGGGNVGCIFGLLVLVLAVVLALRIIPRRVAVAEMEDFIEETAQKGSMSRYTDEVIEGEIMRKAVELELPMTKEKLRVTRNNQEIRVIAEYDVPLDLLVKTHVWHVKHDVQRVLF